MSVNIVNTVNVTVSGTPSLLETPNVANTYLFTNDTAPFAEAYKSYVSASAVSTDWGTSSLTAKMATALFSQVPNIITAGGVLKIVPLLSSVSATAGTFTTANISGNVDNFKVVDDGEMTVTINGIAKDVENLNFTKIATLADIVTVLKTKLPELFIEVVGNTIKFTSKQFGASSTIAFSALSGGTGTSLIGANFLNTAAGASVSGVDSSGESLEQAIARIELITQAVGVLHTLNLEPDAVEDIGDFVQSRQLLYIQSTLNPQDVEPTTGLADKVRLASNFKTRILLYPDNAEDAKIFEAAAFSAIGGTNYLGSNTSRTLNLKALSGLSPSSLIDDSLYLKAKAAGADIYTTTSGLPVYYSFGANQYIDVEHAKIWLFFAIQTNVFNVLKGTNTKIPQTESGMDSLKNSVNQIFNQAVINRTVAPGEWNSPDTFGDPEIFKENISTFGYYTYSQPVADQLQADRELRKAPIIQGACKLAGAIHSSNLIVTVEQ